MKKQNLWKFWQWELWSYQRIISMLRNDILIADQSSRDLERTVRMLDASISIQKRDLDSMTLVAKAAVFRCSGKIRITDTHTKQLEEMQIIVWSEPKWNEVRAEVR